MASLEPTAAEVLLFCDKLLEEDSPDTGDAVLANNLLDQLEDQANLDDALSGIEKLELKSPKGKKLKQRAEEMAERKRRREGAGSTPAPTTRRRLLSEGEGGRFFIF